MSEAVVRIANITILSIGCIEASVIACSFRKDLIRTRSQRILFAKVILSAVMMLLLAVYFYRGPGLIDPLNTLLLATSYVGLYAIFFLYIEYLIVQLNELDPARPVANWVKYFALGVCVTGTMLWLLSAFSSSFRSVSRLTSELPLPFEFGHIGGMVMTVVTLVLIARHYKTLGHRHAIVLSFMPVMMPLASFIEPHIYGIELHYPFILTEIIIVYTQHHLDMELQIEKDEMAETRSRLAMATGRMKPHYLYNVLTTIYYLCETDPLKAQRAIGTFSEYLRATLETLEKQQLVNFSWELGEIRHYLELEKLRFGDRLKIDYDIEAEDFMVPPLSIQPLVENAVKHGVAPKEEGGTVRIVSRRLSDGGAQIRVRDDGVGFDIGELGKLDETHEGIANVKERIRLEAGGDMTITSAPGKGTTAVVTFRPEDNIKRNKDAEGNTVSI